MPQELDEELAEGSLDKELEPEEAEPEMFMCTDCGGMLPAGETFCPECGADSGSGSTDEMDEEIPPDELDEVPLKEQVPEEIEADEIQTQDEVKEPDGVEKTG